jgi:hypothetical protein
VSSSWQEAVKAAIEATAVTWPVSLDHMPDSPDQAVAVYNTGGADPERDKLGERWQPGWQVLLRGAPNDREPVIDAALIINAALEGAGSVTGMRRVLAGQSNPIPVRLDEKRRPVYSLNYRAVVT